MTIPACVRRESHGTEEPRITDAQGVKGFHGGRLLPPAPPGLLDDSPPPAPPGTARASSVSPLQHLPRGSLCLETPSAKELLRTRSSNFCSISLVLICPRPRSTPFSTPHSCGLLQRPKTALLPHLPPSGIPRPLSPAPHVQVRDPAPPRCSQGPPDRHPLPRKAACGAPDHVRGNQQARRDVVRP